MANTAAHEINNLKRYIYFKFYKLNYKFLISFRYDNMVSWHMALSCNQYASTSSNMNNPQNQITNGRSPLDGFSTNGNALSPSTSQSNSTASAPAITSTGRGSKRKASQQVLSH